MRPDEETVFEGLMDFLRSRLNGYDVCKASMFCPSSFGHSDRYTLLAQGPYVGSAIPGTQVVVTYEDHWQRLAYCRVRVTATNVEFLGERVREAHLADPASLDELVRYITSPSSGA